MSLYHLKCSTKCSLGFQKRDVSCILISKEGHILNETSTSCNLAEKPTSQITCNYGDCNSNYFWKTNKWSSVIIFKTLIKFLYFILLNKFSCKCSSNCGFGYQKRTISCMNENGTIVDHKYCKTGHFPIIEQLCFSNCI